MIALRRRRAKMGGMFVVTEKNGSKNDEGKPDRPTTSMPEGQVYQKLHLCDYLRELYEDSEKVSEQSVEKKKELPEQEINLSTHEESS